MSTNVNEFINKLRNDNIIEIIKNQFKPPSS